MSDSEHEQPPSKPIQFARLEYARPAEPLARSRLAILAWALAIVFAAALLISILLPSLNHPRPMSERVKSASNLKQIGLAMQMYANDHNHVFPDSMGTILANEDLTPDVFVNPGSNDTRVDGPTTQAVLADLSKPGHCSYLYFGAGLLDSGDPATVTACEALGSQSWSAAGMNVLFLDGHTEFVSQPAAQQLRAAVASGVPVAWTSSGGITRPATQPTTHP